jgi:hypothetical protein
MLKQIKNFLAWMISALVLPASLGILFLNLTYVAPDVSRLSHPMVEDDPVPVTPAVHVQTAHTPADKL